MLTSLQAKYTLLKWILKTEPKLNVKTKAVVKGKKYAIKVYNLSETQTVTFSSDAPKVATVDAKGTVKAGAIGVATITATVSDSSSDQTMKLQCNIIVGPAAFFVKLTRNRVSLSVGQKTTMLYNLAPLNAAEQPKFFSTAPEIASISAGGVVTAKSEGVAIIFAQVSSGLFDVCTIHVSPEAEIDPNDEEAAEEDFNFADFLIKLNESFTNGDNTSENTDAE